MSALFPPSSLLLHGEILLITDELLAPADFLLHRFLTNHLKGSKNPGTVFVSASENIERWKTISGRSNIHQSTYLDSSLTVIDTMSNLVPATNVSSGEQLKVIYEHIRSTLSLCSAEMQMQRDKLVVLDDLTFFEWIGLPIEEISRFIRAICALCRKFRVSLIIRHHVVAPGEPDELFKQLLQSCSCHLDVYPLTSGRSGSFSGQVALHNGPMTAEPIHSPVYRSAAIHYRLTDTASVFFERGTGNGVL